MSRSAGTDTKSLNDVALADAGLADQDEIGVAADKVTTGEFFDVKPVDGMCIELPVKGFQGFAFREPGFADTVFDRSFTPRRGR